MNAISTATAGILSGMNRFDSASTTLIQSVSGQSTADPASAIVDQTTADEQVKASTAVLKTSDQMIKQLLDIKV
jgi:flagellar hook protein FlgE